MDPVEFVEKTFEESIDITASFVKKNGTKICEIAEVMAKAILRGNKILVCGNGGSACDASHLTGEMLGRLSVERNPLPAVCLTTDIGAMTAIANDYGYEEVFSRQLQGLSRPGDILIAISTSGNSANVDRACRMASCLGVIVIGILGRDGGTIRSLCNHSLIIEQAKSSSRCQETYLVAIHTIVDLIDRYYLKPVNQ